MTNIKRVLSLALAAVMLMGMMVIGAGAKDAADFGDYNEVQYTEAMDVMIGLKIIDGDDQGQLNPAGNLTREQAAKIICYLLMGKEGADLLSAEAAPFADVAATRWSAGYIAYCKSEGIISGIGNNKFNPTGNVTAAEFAKMLLGALGYESKNEGFTGTQWSINVTKTAQKAGLFEGDSSVTANLPLTREEACLYALNTLTADMVEYTGGVDVSTGDTTVTVGAVRDEVTNTRAKDYRTDVTAQDTVMQFCEQYFKDLKKDTTAANTADAFGRPGYTWTYNSAPIAFAAEKAVLVYTGAVKAADVAKALANYYVYIDFNAGSTDGWKKVNNTTTYAAADTIDASSSSDALVINNNGAGADVDFTAANNTIAKALADLTANGKVVEVYADKDNHINKIVTITYTAGEVTNVVTAKDKTTYYVDTTVSGIDYVDADEDDTVVLAGDVAKGDIVTYVKLTGGSLYIYPTTKVVGALSSISTKDNTVTVNGTAYEVGAATNAVAIGSYAISSDNANFFLDQYGYAVKTSNIVNNNFAYVVGSYGTVAGSVDGGTPSAQVKVVFADGAVGTYDLKLTKTGNTYKAAGVTIYDGTGDSAAVDSRVATLEGEIFAYALEGNTIELTALTAMDDTRDPSSDGKYTTELSDVADNEGSIANNATSTKVAKTTAQVTALMNSETVYVFYNPQDGTAVSITGNTNIKGYNVANTDTNAIVAEKDGTAYTVKYVFVSDVAYSAASHEYVYVNTAKFVKTVENGNTYYAYEATKADGSTVTVKAKTTALTDNGLYILNDDLSVADTDAVYTYDSSWGVRNSYARGAIFAQGTADVNGSLVSVDGGTTYYNMSADVQTVYIDDTKAEVDGSSVIIVRGWDNGATSEVVSIFVIG